MKLFSEQLQKNRKGARGFTLVEILIVVALIVILLAVSVAGLMKLRKNIRQRELDSKAEIIYMAAQHRLTALKTGGFQELYTPEGNSDVVKRIGRPFDAADDNDQADKVCYVKSSLGDGHIEENSGAASILPVSSVDRQLWDNHWVIEFCPETGTVYAVFYSEEPIQEVGEALELRLDGLRVKQLRLDDGARIGYYGGDLTSITLSDALVPSVVVENAEKLKVTFSSRVPKPMKLKFTIYIYDENNEPNWNNLASEQEQQKVCIREVTPKLSAAASYQYQWILDSLDPKEGSFYKNTEGKIPAGANICIKLKVEEDTEGSLIAPKSITVTDNGIFAYKQDGKKNTAYIAYGRHLQNLHPGISMLGEKVQGGPGVEITSAIQVGDISFMENEADPDCFYNLYTAKNIGFVPIVNNTLVSYAGEKITEGGKEIVPAIQGLTIDSKESYVGLFGSYRGIIKDLMMTGTRITGSNGAFAGTLIGIASGETTIDNVQVFLSQRLGDLVGAGLAPTQERDPQAVAPWVEGRIVGGLVGAYTTGKGLHIVNSSASTVLSGSQYAGGLVGAVSGPTYIDGSYADCYLKAEKTGGLIGTTGPGVALTMNNFYAVGYQVATRAAAGLTTYGDEQATYYPVRMYNGYAACQILTKQANTKVYNTVKNYPSVSALCVVYLSQNLLDDPVKGSRSVSYQELASDAVFRSTDSSGQDQPHLVSSNFTRQTTDIDNSSNPYNLMNQGLIKYSYPRLINMRHYGDWNAEFENGALVYFEYNGTAGNGTYNFEGGNIYVNNIRRDDTKLNYQDRALVNGDGYALAFSGEQTVDKLRVFYNGNQVTLGNSIRVGNYTLFPLDPNLVNREDLLGDSFYQKLTVQYPVIDLTGTTTDTQIEKEDTFYFNPHFAKCIGASQTDVPDVVRVRSPRHLYALSQLFEKYQPLLKGSRSMISQDTDLDYWSYEWGNCYRSGFGYDAQAPIGQGEVPFDLTYSGNGNTVTRLHIRTEGNDAGLFGRIAADGKVTDLVLLGDNETVTHFENTPEPDTGTQAQETDTEFSLINGTGKVVNIGAIAGFNQGQIINCAVSGYSLDVRAYNGATANVGGLVGQNYRGFLRACTAETPRIAVKSYLANTYSGGLVGVNDGGSVYNSYAAGFIDVTEAETKDQDYTNIIAGLTGQNRSGNVFRCYAGMAMSAAGETEVYGLSKKGGSVIGSYYLDGGTYVYRDELYSFNSSQNKYIADAMGQPITAEELSGKTLDEYGTSQLTMNAGKNPEYPYPATVSRRGVKVQYGYWPDNIKDFGQFGVFYWENEVGGNNAGLHMTLMGTNSGIQTAKQSTLCRAHNDGGRITAYGYGIFYKEQPTEDKGMPTLVAQNCVLGERNADAEARLEAQMGEYKFIAYTTGVGDDKLHMTGADGRKEDNFAREANRNATWKLYYPAVQAENGGDLDDTKSGVYTYSVSPFFGDAYSLQSISLVEEAGSTPAEGRAKPGSEDCPYGVRAIDQLQFINWNYGTMSTTHFITAKYTGGSNHINNCRFPYLVWGNKSYSPTGKKLQLNWLQSHDIDASAVANYTPIGSMYDNADSNANADADMAFFDSSYDGQAYVIKNIKINTNAECVGLFGITAGAKLKNIVMYSDDQSQILHNEEAKGWYCIGGLAGMAGSRSDPGSVFENCTVSGYRILDRHKANPGWGGGCVGGLVGATNMNIEGCTAVNDIDICIGYNGEYQNCRVAGLVGCARAEITNCYAGGSITSSTSQKATNSKDTASIWISGVSGGIVLRDGGNLKDLIGSVSTTTQLYNCYSYVELPEPIFDNTNGNSIKNVNSIASNGELQAGFAQISGNNYVVLHNCYALSSAVSRADDYKMIQTKGNVDWNASVNLSPRENQTGFPGSGWTREKRKIELQNGGNSPFVDYQELRNLISDGKLTTFSPVSKSESGVATEGKFTFPGGDRMLEGLDYPFPAILTQNGKFVHYGAWPKLGIYWESKQATLDLVEDHTAQGTRMLSAASLLIDYGDYESVEEEEEADQTPTTDEKKPSEKPTETPNTLENQKPTETGNTTVTDDPNNTDDPKNTKDPKDPETPENPEAPGNPEDPEDPENPEDPDGTEDDQNTRQTISNFAAVRMRGAATLDAEGVNARLIHKLYVIGLTDVQESELTFSCVDANNPAGGELDDTKAPAKITNVGTLSGDGDGSYYPVEFQGIRPGSMKVTATVTRDVEYSTSFILRVTAELNVSIVSLDDDSPVESITIYEGDTADDMFIALSDKRGNKFVPDKDKVKWTMSLGGKDALVSWTPNDFIEPIMDEGAFTGAYKLHGIQGVTAGEGALQLELNYTWPQDETVTVTGALSIPVTVYPSDVLGLGDNVSFDEITLPHTKGPDDQTEGTAKTYEEGKGPKRTGDGLYLYASNLATSYTTLGNLETKGFTVEEVQLKVGGGDYTALDKQTREENAVSEVFKTENDTYSFRVEIPDAEETEGVANGKFVYRMVDTQTNLTEDQWSLKLTLKDKETGKTYTLTYDRPNFVTFVFRTEEGETEQDQVLKVFRVPQGNTLLDAYPGITEDSLAQELCDAFTLPVLQDGYHWTWKLPEGEISKDLRIPQTEEPISYNVKYDPNYPSGFGLETTMEDSLFTYGSENTLKDATYTCMGYSFIGWAEKADAAEPDYLRLEDGTFEETFADYIKRKDGTDTVLHHGDNLILYAVWKMMDYTITFDSGRCPEQSYKDAPRTVSWNVSKAGDTIPKVAYTWDGYTLDGWTLDPNSTEAMFHEGDLLYAVTSAVPSEYAPRVYAVWKPVDYTVTRISAGTELDPITWNLDSPADAKVGAPIRQGYTFQGWAYSEGATEAVTADTLLKEIVVQDGERGNRTLYALWTLNTYTLTYKNGDAVVKTVDWNVEMQEELTVGGGWETLTKDGFTFQGWTDESGTPVGAETLLKDIFLSGTASGRTLTAEWEAVPSTSSDEGENDGLDMVTIQAPAKAPAPVPPPTPTPDQPETEDPPTPDPVTPPDETGDEDETEEPKEDEEPKETEETEETGDA